MVADFIFRSVICRLARFVPTPRTFIRVLDDYNAVIAGWVALLILLPGSYDPIDLEIYVPYLRHTLLIQVLCAEYGFIITARQQRTELAYPTRTSIARSFTMCNPALGSTLQIFVSDSLTAIEPVFESSSTLVMNFISSSGVYCAYPTLTLSKRGLPNRDHREEASVFANWKTDYVQQGIDFQERLSDWSTYDEHRCTSSGCCPLTIRSLHDSNGLFFQFPRHEKKKAIQRPIYYEVLATKPSSIIWGISAKCQNIRGERSRKFTTSI
ncbi:hypothetical protein FPV67DRAFT_1436661 [Lyophyllum atratum]|nr:hypothetical protein FPV67DRAFT_1436661 [Lyophyllum atratum]